MAGQDPARRVLDVCASSVALVVLSPVVGWVAWRVSQELGRPVLFRQQRAGRGGVPFRIHKFRSMSDDDPAAPRSDEARLSDFGRWLRSTSLDELPQLLDVLRGDMAVVGPRPLPVAYVERYDATQRRRLEVRPGITGWAQVNGRNALTWEDRFALDVWYVEHRSVWLDLRIIGRTIGTVLRREGIAAEGAATMPEFLGSASADGTRSDGTAVGPA